jgi:tetratricopeptide (TPR) repeat protein/ribosomal protein L40E
MFCIHCGSEVPTGARFCAACGQSQLTDGVPQSHERHSSQSRQSAPTDEYRGPRITALHCPVCGAPLAPEDARCRYCGSVVVIETDHPRIDPSKLNKAVIDDRIAKYRTAARRDPNDETAHYGLGVAYFNLGLLDDSARELSEAARLMPENPHIQHQLAVVYAELAKVGRSEAEMSAWDRLNRALLLSTANADSYLLKADLHLRKGERRQAIEAWSCAFAIEPSSIRQPIAAFLSAHKSTFLQAPQFGMTTDRGDDYGSRAAAIGVGSFVALIVIALIGDNLVADKSGWSDFLAFLAFLAFGAMIVGPIVVIVRGRNAQRSSALIRETFVHPEAQPFLSGQITEVSRLLGAAEFVVSQLEWEDQRRAAEALAEERRNARAAQVRAHQTMPQFAITPSRKRKATGCSGCGTVVAVLAAVIVIVAGLLAA